MAHVSRLPLSSSVRSRPTTGLMGGYANMQVGHAAKRWVDSRAARREINELTAANYHRQLTSFAEHVGAQAVGDVTTEDFESWLATQRVAGSTLNTRAAPVRAFFGWCAARGHIGRDPTLGVARSRNGRPFPRRVTADAIGRMLIVADFRATVVLMLGLHLGLRCCEMSRLRIEHWDRQHGTLDVHGKGDKWRTLPVAGEVDQVLNMWITDLGERRGPVFPSMHTDAAVNPNTISSIVTKVARTAEASATAHRLRHTFGWNLVEAGVPLPVVQALLGHESLTTTTIYTTAGAADLREHMARWRYLPAAA